MANIFQKLWSKATFWDQNDDRQVAKDDEEERRRRNQAAVAASSVSRPTFNQPTANPTIPVGSNNKFDFSQPLKKDLNTNPIIGSQSQFTLQKAQPTPVEQPKVSQKQQELDAMAADELDRAREEASKGEGFFGRNFLNKKAIEERAVATARNRATQKYQDKYGWNADPEVLAYNKGTTARLNVESDRLKKDAENLNNFSKTMDKVGEVAGYIPVTGSVLNLGLAGTEKLAKATGNDAYAADIGDQRLRLDVGMNQEEFNKLDPETQQKLRNLQNLGLALSPLDFLGAGGLAKSGAIAAGKKGAMEFIEKGAMEATTKAALKKALIAEGKSAIVPFVAGTAASVGGQAYLGGTDNIDPLEALKTGVLTAGASKILPFESKKAAKGRFDIPQEADEIPIPTNLKGGAEFNVEEALKKAEEGVDVETPQLPGARASSEVDDAYEVAPGFKSTNTTPAPTAPKVNIPDPTNPIALARAGDDVPINVANPQAAETPKSVKSKVFLTEGQQGDVMAQFTGTTDRLTTIVNANATEDDLIEALTELRSIPAAQRSSADNIRITNITKTLKDKAASVKTAPESTPTDTLLNTQVADVPMADFSKSVNAPLKTATPPEGAPLQSVPEVAPNQTDLAEAAAQGELRQSTRTDAELDANGNPVMQADAQVAQQAIDSGIAPQRQASPVATAEEAMARAADEAAKQEVQMAAPRTRAEAVTMVDNEAARLDVADTFKTRDVANIAETQAAATQAIRELDDAELISVFRAEPEIKTPQQFFETVSAVERLGRGDATNPESVRALTNALDGISSFSSRAGRDLRMVKELFANLPPEMRKQYLVDRIESKLGVDLPDNQRAELLGKITAADNTQNKINDVVGRLENAQKNVELGVPVDEAAVKADIDNLDKLTTVHEYQQGDAFQYSQDLLQGGTPGAKVAQATKTAMLSSPLRRTADVITTGITSASDTASNAISGLIGRALNKLPGQAGKFRETRAGDYGTLVKGNIEGLKDSFTSLRTDNRKVDDIMGELQKNTRSDANNAGRTRAGRFVGDMTEMATNATQGQRDQRLRELARQEGQKLGLEGTDLDLYTKITEAIPSEVQKHEASQYHLRTNNLHDNKLNTVFRSVASVIEKQFPNAGPIVNALTVPFKSYQAGMLNRLFTDKTVLGNAYTMARSAARGDMQGVVDSLGKAAVNTGETLVLGALLTQAGVLKDTNDNGEDFAGPYLQTPFGDIPVGFFGPTGLNIVVGHNLSKMAESGDVDAFVNSFAKQAIGFMNIDGSLGGNTPIQEMISGQGDFTDRATKAAGDTIRRPIPSMLGDLNAVGNTISGAEKPLIKATNEDGTKDYVGTEVNRTIDKLGLSALLDREEGKTSQSIIDRITGGTHSSDATNQAEVEANRKQDIKDLEKELKKAKVPLKEAEIEDALDSGDYDNAIKGLEFNVAKLESDPETKNATIENAKDKLLQAQLRKEGVPVTDDGIKARTESGDYLEAIAGYTYQLQKLDNKKDIPESKRQSIRDEITRLQVTANGSYPPSVIKLYSEVSVSEWRAMGNPESEDYDPEMYQTLWQYDQQLAEKGVSRSSKGGEKQKYSAAKGRGGSGGGGSRNKGFTTDIALQKFSGADFSPQKVLSADFATPKSAIPVLEKVPNNDQSKKKKISITKGGRA